jgi:hypothetical protein
MADAEKKKRMPLTLGNLFKKPLEFLGQVVKEDGAAFGQGVVMAYLGGAPLSLKTAADVAEAMTLDEMRDELVTEAMKAMPEGYDIKQRSAFEAGVQAEYAATVKKLKLGS